MAVAAFSFGAVMVLLSLWLRPYQEQGSGEWAITEVNIVIGIVLLVAGFLFLRIGERKK